MDWADDVIRRTRESYQRGLNANKDELTRLRAEVARLTAQLAKAQRESGLDRAALFDQARDYQEQINTLKKKLAAERAMVEAGITTLRNAEHFYEEEQKISRDLREQLAAVTREREQFVSMYTIAHNACLDTEDQRDAALDRVAALTAVLTRIPLSTQTAAMQREMQKAVRGG